ncbi:MAG: helix-turn-helix transcriptional regulator [Roseburia sp.]|nr:helix-turn-helix transcriptional regulator [Roseburia sp.]
MKYIDYIERTEQGAFNFPIAFYHQTPLSPRYLMQYHWHTHYELIHIISGSFQLHLEKESQIYHAGDVLFIPGGSLHGGTPHDCIYDCIVFDLQILMKDNHACTKIIRDIMTHKMWIPTHLSEKCDDILPLVTKLCDSLASKEPGYEFMVQGYLYHLLGIIINRELYEKEEIDRTSAERITSIKNVLSYISENYQNSISLDTLSKIAGMNPKYFCRYFRNITSRTPIDYLNYYRIECACEMLSTKDISIKEVAISCGFNDESYFIKTFHKYKGTTPKQFTDSRFI